MQKKKKDDALIVIECHQFDYSRIFLNRSRWRVDENENEVAFVAKTTTTIDFNVVDVAVIYIAKENGIGTGNRAIFTFRLSSTHDFSSHKTLYLRQFFLVWLENFTRYRCQYCLLWVLISSTCVKVCKNYNKLKTWSRLKFWTTLAFWRQYLVSFRVVNVVVAAFDVFVKIFLKNFLVLDLK